MKRLKQFILDFILHCRQGHIENITQNTVDNLRELNIAMRKAGYTKQNRKEVLESIKFITGED